MSPKKPVEYCFQKKTKVHLFRSLELFYEKFSHNGRKSSSVYCLFSDIARVI
jgi:hypothetical protein